MIEKVKILITCFLILLTLQCSEGLRIVGKLSIEGVDNLYFRIYQYDEFDSATALRFDVVDENDSVKVRQHFFTGTHDYVNDLEHFTAACHDSIVYMTYGNPEIIFAVYDLKSQWCYPQGTTGENYNDKFRKADILISRLQKHNPKLRANYKE